MTKIKSKGPRRLTQPPAAVAELASKLASAPESEIPGLVAGVSWTWPKSDFFFWTPVLNRFDSILETVVAKHDLKHLQTVPFSPATKELLLAVLDFTRTLWDNCTNRNVYASYEHLNELLVTDDADVLEALLRLLQRPAQRVSQQRHLKSSLAFSQQRILTLASSWHTKDAGLDLSQLARRDVNIPEGLGMVAFQFYRTAADIGTSTAPGDKSTDAPSNSAPGPATPKPGSGLKTAHATPSAKGKEPAEPSTPVPGKPSGASGPPAEGLVLVTGPISDRPDKQILQSLVEEFSVPEQHNFALLHRIRVTRALQHPDARLQMLRIRVLALSALVQLFPEDVSQSKIFLYEPGLSQRLVDIAVAPDVSRDLQVVALSTLEAIARLRGHLSEVISALNATSNLGPLMSLLRKTLAALDSDEPEVPQDYVETVFSLVSFLTTTQSGSPMITSSGVIPALVGLLSNSRPSQLKNVLKATSILDTVVYGFQDGFQMLVTAGGLDVVIQRIEAETRFCVDLAKSSSSSSVVEQEGNVSEGEPPRVDQSEDVVMGDVERPPMDVDGADPTMETIKMDMSPALPINSHAADAPHERLSLLRALLKFVLHMMQTSGTADRLRNLIDSTLPNSLLQVLAFSKTFGPGVFSLATNIMSTFIHNEPTSLSILQELKLPQTFLASIKQHIPFSPEVVSAIPTAYGAICLNQAGLDMYNAIPTMDPFLEIFTTESYLRPLLDNEVPQLIGTSLDELMRHQTSLKEGIIESVVRLVRRVNEIGLGFAPNAKEDSALSVKSSTDDETTSDERDRKDSLICQYIDVVSRILEGLFGNVSHCKDFVRMQGVEELLKYYTLPAIPADFSTSNSSYTLSHMLRVLTEMEPKLVINALVQSLSATLQEAVELADGEDSLVNKFLDLNAADADLVDKGNHAFRTLIRANGYFGLLADFFYTPVVAPSKSVAAVLQLFCGPQDLIAMLGHLQRFCLTEIFILRGKVPRAWWLPRRKSMNAGEADKSQTSEPMEGTQQGVSAPSAESGGGESSDQASTVQLTTPTTVPEQATAACLTATDIQPSAASRVTTSLQSNTGQATDIIDALSATVSFGDLTPLPEVQPLSDTHDPALKNFRNWKFLLNQIPTCFAALFQGVLKLLFQRRISDPAQRKNAFKVVAELAKAIVDALTVSTTGSHDATVTKPLIATILGQLNALLFEERNLSALQTPLAVAFVNAGGLHTLMELLKQFWADAKAAQESCQANRKDRQLRERLGTAHGIVELILDVVSSLVDSKLLHESQSTQLLVQKDKDRSSPEFFDPYDHVVASRVQVVETLEQIWADSFLADCPPNTIHSVLKLVAVIVKGDGEVSAKTTGSFVSTIFGALGMGISAGGSSRQADEEKVQQLVDMGFPRTAAETALIRTGNHVGRAAEYLLTHPHVVAAANFAAASENSGGTGVGASPSATSARVDNASDPAIGASVTAGDQGNGLDASGDGQTSRQGGANANEDAEMADEEDDENAALARALAMSLAPEGPSTAPPTESSLAAPPSSTEGKEALPESKVEEGRARLQNVRARLKDGLFDRALLLLDACEHIVFDLQQLLAAGTDDEFKAQAETLLDSISKTGERDLLSEATGARLKARLRLLALLAHEPNGRLGHLDAYATFVGPLLRLIGTANLEAPAGSSSDWFTSAILLAETYLAADELVRVDRSDSAGGATPPNPKQSISDQETVALVGTLLKALRSQGDNKDLVNADLRLLVRLTRKPGCAREFVVNDGVDLVLGTIDKVVFPGQQAMIVTVLRHLFEDEDTLGLLMENEIALWLRKRSMARAVDVSSFVKGNSQLACRDANGFVKSTSGVAKLVGYDTGVRNPQIALAKTEPRAAETGGTVSATPATSADQQQQPPLELVAGSAHLPGTANKSEMPSLSAPGDLTALVRKVVETFLATEADRKKSSKLTEEVVTDEQIRRHIQRCFTLQVLTELATSFIACRSAIVSFDAEASVNIGGSLVTKLLEDVLPVVKPSTDAAAAHAGTIMDLAESTLATQLLVVLCIGNAAGEGALDGVVATSLADKRSDWLQTQDRVRKQVLDAVAKMMKDAIAAPVPADDRYTRYAAYAELVTRVITTKTSQSTARPNEEPVVTQVSKDLLDKGIVSLLAAMVADVDVHHPTARIVISILLKPIELLSKVATKVGNSTDSASNVAADGKSGVMLSLPVISVPPTSDHIEDIDEMVRTSALGVLNAPDEEDMDDISDEEDLEDGEEDFDDGDEDGSDEEGDLSEAEDQDMDLVHQPYRRDVSIQDPEEHGSQGSEGSEPDESMNEDTGDEGLGEGEEGDSDEDGDSESGSSASSGSDNDDEDASGDDDMSWDDVEEVEDVMDAQDLANELGGAVGGELVPEGDGAEAEHMVAMPEDAEEAGEEAVEGAGAEEAEYDGEDEVDALDEGSESASEDDDNGMRGAFAGDAMLDLDAMEEVGGILPRMFGGRPGMGRRRNRLGRRHIFDLDLGADGPGAFDPLLGGDLTINLEVPRGTTSTGGDLGLHPLLAAPPQLGIGTGEGQGRSRLRLGEGSFDLQTFEDMLGGNALQLLQTVLGRAASRGGTGTYRVEIPMPADRRTANLADILGREAGIGGGVSSTGRAMASLMDPRVTIIHAFTPLGSNERWVQEARLLFGANYAEKTGRIAAAIVQALGPAALEATAKRREAERIRKEEEERKKKLEEEEKARKRAEEEAAAKAKEEEEKSKTEAEPASGAAAAEANVDQSPSVAPESAGTGLDSAAGPSATEHARVTVMVEGQEYDITDTGIDPTFLEALPESLRAEVIQQHIREARRSRATGGTGASQTAVVPEPVVASQDEAISQEFLDALPPDIREELLMQQRLEREERVRQQTRGQGPADAVAGPVADLDPASFLATLDPSLRQVVLLEQDEGFLQQLPPAVVAEANNLRDRARRTNPSLIREALFGAGAAAAGPSGLLGSTVAGKKASKEKKDARHLLDKASLASLVRLMFVPEAAGKNTLHRLLLHLTENGASRADLTSLLLSILVDGSSDLVAVDRSFAQLTIRGKPKAPSVASTPLRPGVSASTSSVVAAATAVSDNIPDLVAQRCLEALSYLATFNERVVSFFLAENEDFASSFFNRSKSSSRKAKGKEKVANLRYPVVVLMSLLERSTYLNSSSLMDALMFLLSHLLRPLPNLVKKENVVEVKPVEEASTSAAGATGSSGSGDASGTQPATEAVPTSAESGGAAGEQITKGKAGTGKHEMHAPVIPDQYLHAVVNVLTAGECSSKTFQYTLSVIQHLCSVPTHRETITAEIMRSSQRLGDEILGDLADFNSAIKVASKALEIEDSLLAKFSKSSSHQAKLLRLLKTIDFVSARTKQNAPISQHLKPAVGGEGAESSSQGAPAAAPSGAAPGQTASSESKATDPHLVKKEQYEALIALYDNLDFLRLWQSLGEALTAIGENDELSALGSVLLPLMEAFMVVAKPYVLSKVSAAKSQSPSSSSMSPRSPARGLPLSNEDLFSAFTDAHRKILNSMVRSNPSLMSGSFALLVNNPRVLDFDNKRSYFQQQLHKRTSRDHYGTTQLNVRRQYVFEDSFHQMQGKTGNEVKYGKLSVRFYDEEGVDAGGVTREWFSALARQMFNPDYALFKPSAADRVTYQPNQTSWINPDHLSYFKFVGRVIGKAIYDGRLLDCYFTRSFYKHILGIAVDYRDVEAVDPEYYKSLEWILKNDITDVLDLTFSTEIDEFGVKKVVDLKENGHQIPVTEENKAEYVKLVTEQRLTVAIHQQIEAFLSGLHDVIPASLLSIFNEQELELLISGMPDIDIDDWKNNTEYQNYNPSSPQIQWFWRTVRSFSQEERAKLLQFVTGTSKIPLEGFAHLQGSSGVQKFQIHRDFSGASRLASAHTCFNQLDLPAYESYEQLRQALLTAINETSGFGFA